MKNRPSIQYDYIVRNIAEDDAPAYEAYIPAIDATVFGDNLSEIEEGVSMSIDAEL